MRNSLATFFALGWLAAACANPVNVVNYNKYLDAGHAALDAGEMLRAKMLYSHAMGNARVGGLGPKSEAAALYNYGLAAGMLCEYDLAKESFVEALRLEEEVEGPDGGYSSKRLFELARLEYDHDNFADSARWYDRAIPLARKFGVDRQDPIAYANELDRYANALERSGDPARAAAARAQSAELREQHPGAQARFVPRTYPKECAKS